jgi:hypothetical protein
MRLSLYKAAHATMGGAVYRKSGSRTFLCETWDTANLNLRRWPKIREDGAVESHPRKKREGPRISYCAAPAMAACAALYKESRMRFVDPTKPYRKSGGMGHPTIRSEDRVCSLENSWC